MRNDCSGYICVRPVTREPDHDVCFLNLLDDYCDYPVYEPNGAQSFPAILCPLWVHHVFCGFLLCDAMTKGKNRATLDWFIGR
jgi:hypothetical protein